MRDAAPAGRGAVLELDLSALSGADLGLVDALARLALEARRHGARLRLVGGPHELAELIELAGLADVLGFAPASAGKSIGQPEEREEPRRVEEERHGRDPIS